MDDTIREVSMSNTWDWRTFRVDGCFAYTYAELNGAIVPASDPAKYVDTLCIPLGSTIPDSRI
jgi:hypothetical protein